MPFAKRKHENESFESLFRRWKKSVENDGLLQELKSREHYEKPSIKRKRAKAAAKKRSQRLIEQEKENMNLRRKPFSKKKEGRKKENKREEDDRL